MDSLFHWFTINRQGRHTLKAWVMFGLLNALIGLLVGACITWTSVAKDYWALMLAAPIAAFGTGSFFWNWIIGNRWPIAWREVLITGLATGIVSHYFTWLFLGFGLNLAYFAYGVGGGTLGNPPASVWDMFQGAFVVSFTA